MKLFYLSVLFLWVEFLLSGLLHVEESLSELLGNLSSSDNWLLLLLGLGDFGGLLSDFTSFSEGSVDGHYKWIYKKSHHKNNIFLFQINIWRIRWQGLSLWSTFCTFINRTFEWHLWRLNKFCIFWSLFRILLDG